MNVTINNEQRLFVINSGSGFSCYGFDNCFDEASQLAEKLGQPAPLESQKGAIEQYLQHQELISKAHNVTLGTWFNRHTPPAVQRILEDARNTGWNQASMPVPCYGDTPLIAAMRSYVTSVAGEEFEVPDEIVN